MQENVPKNWGQQCATLIIWGVVQYRDLELIMGEMTRK